MITVTEGVNPFGKGKKKQGSGVFHNFRERKDLILCWKHFTRLAQQAKLYFWLRNAVGSEPDRDTHLLCKSLVY